MAKIVQAWRPAPFRPSHTAADQELPEMNLYRVSGIFAGSVTEERVLSGGRRETFDPKVKESLQFFGDDVGKWNQPFLMELGFPK
jgi:hypothetical protein